MDNEALALHLHKTVMLPSRGLEYDDTPVKEEDWRMRDEEIDGLKGFMGNAAEIARQERLERNRRG